jgi:hypothetical protein
VNHALFALLASVIVSSALGKSTESTRIRITTWNLQWFPNGSAKEASAEQQNQRIKEAAPAGRPFCIFRITASCDFVRQLLREAEAAGETVKHEPDSPVYFLDGFPIKAVSYLPKNTFLIELDPPDN